MTITNALASVAVKEIKAAMEWHTKVIGRPAEAARLNKLGIATGAQMGAQTKVFMVKDPDGNSIAFVQAPDPGNSATSARDAYHPRNLPNQH